MLSVEPALAGLFGAFGSGDDGIGGAEGEYSPANGLNANPSVAYRLALYDVNNQELPIDANGNATIAVGEDFRLVGYHRDITYDEGDFVGEGVYAGYVDIFHTNAHRLMVRHGETQQLDFLPLAQNPPIAGSFTLTFKGETTAPIDFSGNVPKRIEDALLDLPSIGPGNVQVRPAPEPENPSSGVRPIEYRVQFMKDLGERDLPLLEINTDNLTGLFSAEISKLFPADLDNAGTFRSSFSGVSPFVNGVNATLEGHLEPEQPAGGSVWSNVGSFLSGFWSLDKTAEFAFFSVDIRAVAPGRVEFSASAPNIEPGVSHGFETLVFPTIPSDPEFVVDPEHIEFAQTLDNPLVLNILGPPTADIAGRSAEDGTWLVGESTGEQFVSSPWGQWPSVIDWQDVVVGDFTGDGRDDIAGRNNGEWWVTRSTPEGAVNERWTSWSTSVSWTNVMVADVNGDGKDDIVGRVESSGDWWVALSTGSGFVNQRWGIWSPLAWQDIMVADVNGDGKADIVGRLERSGDWWVALSNGSGFVNQRWGSWSPLAWTDVMVADLNGDGRDDIVGRIASTGDWWVARSTGSSFVNERWGGWSPLTWTDVMVADVNGDGQADIVGRLATTGDWWVARSTGSTLVNELWGKWSNSTWLDVQVADVNGNGWDDIVGRDANGNWLVARSTATKFVNEHWGSWDPGVAWVDVVAFDANGDGNKSDLIGRGHGIWQLAKSMPSGLENQVWGEWPQYVEWQDVLVADVTGDGLDDVVGRDAQGFWWVAQSTNSGFVAEPWGKWSTSVSWINVMVADVNGDGKGDIIGRTASGGDWWVALSTGSGFVNQRWGMWSPLSWKDIMVADVNGDGKADIVGRVEGSGDWWVARSTGTSFVNERWGGWSPLSWTDVMVADVNGDGQDDIVGRIATTGDWWVALSTETGLVNQHWGRWSPNQSWSDVHAADFDGDGRADLVGRDGSGNWTVSRSTGTEFANETWGSWPTDVVWQDVLIGNFSNRIPDAMHTAGLPPADHGPVSALTEADLQWIVDAAIPQWAEAAGGDADAHPLHSVTFQIADLPGTLLGQTMGTTVLIDRNAAGFGWFVDQTPWADEEFWRTADGELLALPDGPADGRMDLLTVVMHELGHVLGYDHSDSGLMQPTLAPGVRYRWDDLLGDDLVDDGEGESAVDDFFATM